MSIYNNIELYLNNLKYTLNNIKRNEVEKFRVGEKNVGLGGGCGGGKNWGFWLKKEDETNKRARGETHYFCGGKRGAPPLFLWGENPPPAPAPGGRGGGRTKKFTW